ncbi:GspH/FimT family pseudopilin [Ramlibacter alkalitolerans]|uniref:Type II secretion system protein H n=1 Tax=Ramlibacter alkalitolerans TaxID=2039631 RepID=A0ABS1JNQ9_9BURK|nr:GspH/FimT family pseudopilin [Ramlibacter alkalitolerans]
MLKLRQQRGVSLIEVMVGLTLVGIMTAIGVPAFRTGMLNRQIRGMADSIQGGLVLAKTEALRRNRIVKFELGGTPGSWLVGCETADTSLVDGQEACPATIQSRTGTDTTGTPAVAVVQMDIGGGGPAEAESQVNMNPMGRTTPDTLPAGKMKVYQVTYPGGGTCATAGGEMRCLNVVVTAMGQIRMCDPKTTSPDSRACPW